MRTHMFVLVTIAALLAGCAPGYFVQVIDVEGRPVEGVKAQAVGLTVNGTPATTNAVGWTRVPFPVTQEPYWLRMQPAGTDWRDLPWPDKWPVRFVLREGALTEIEK